MRARGQLRLVVGAFVVVGLSAGGLASASTSTVHPSRSLAPPSTKHGRIAGIVRPRGAQKGFSGQGSGPLTYHGGPVMHTNVTRAIYWIPDGYSVDAHYQDVIDGFFTNVAADSGKPGNVYATDTEYSDGSGPIAYDSTFAGSTVVTDPFPASDCTDAGLPVCLTDAQLQTEIDNVVTANGWPKDTSHLYFLFTPQQVGSCFDDTSVFCAFSYYCAYHSDFSSSTGGGTIVYANQPYAATSGGCDTHERPNGDDADATINVASHEHNESITDPLVTAWYDAAGYENGDKCAWDFGNALGSTGAADNSEYNEQIGTGEYYLQQEWSNTSLDRSGSRGACLQRYAPEAFLLGSGTGTLTLGGTTCTASPCDLTAFVGKSVTLKPIAGVGSHFTGWSNGCSGTGACTIKVASSTALLAHFERAGLPSPWVASPLRVPRTAFPAGDSPNYSFFTAAVAAQGTERAETVYNSLPGKCYFASSDTGGIYLQRRTPTGWKPDGVLTAPDVGTDGASRWANCFDFGSQLNLSADGSTLLVSQDPGFAYSNELGVRYRCAAFVYARVNGTWTQQGTLFPDGADETGSATHDGCNYFGAGGALAADHAAVLDWGVVYVYARDGTTWSLEQKLTLPADDGCSRQLGSVQIAFDASASELVTTDQTCTVDGLFSVGRAYVYTRSGSTWSDPQEIDGADPVYDETFGRMIALSQDGKTMVVTSQTAHGVPDSAGAAWVYERVGGSWALRTELTAPHPENQTTFVCSSVVRGGARILCGSFATVGLNAKQGAIFVFDRPAGGWRMWSSRFHPTTLWAPDGSPFDVLGRSGELGWQVLASSDAGDTIDATFGAFNAGTPPHDARQIGYEFTASH